jgi:transcriptional regulator with XRE-family HTH domain
MKMAELNAGERLFIRRRRDGLTIAQAAKRSGSSLYRYKRWEEGKLAGAPVVKLGALAFHERATILRRRSGLSVIAFAKRLGVTPWWVTQMESGHVNPQRLRDHWGGDPVAVQARAKRQAKAIARRTSKNAT